MKTPNFQLVMRAVAAVAVALAGSFLAVPALAEAGTAEPTQAAPSASPTAGPAATSSAPVTAPSTSPVAAPAASPAASPTVSPTAAPVAPAVSDAGLAEAVRRDLGLTLEEFNAAGQLGKTAAHALPTLRGLPGYVGVSLKGGKIVVEGSGAELQARIQALNEAGPAADFVLVVPAVAVPLKVPSAADLIASNTDQLFGDYVREVGPAGLQAVAYADGHFVIRTGGTSTAEAALPAVLDPRLPSVKSETPAPGKVSAAEFAARYKNVQLEKGTPIKTEEDFFGGQGYTNDLSSVCSAGFGAYGPGGVPLVLTAGHCAYDGAARGTYIEDTSSSAAAGAKPVWPFVTAGTLGTFGFSQFGGLQNSRVLDPTWETGDPGEPGNVGTDIAVIGGIRPNLALQPAATRWRGDAPKFSTADPTNPGPTAVKIIGMVAPFQGQAVCLSGRTTGWSCGRVDEIGIYVVGGTTYANNPSDVRAFSGFRSNTVESNGGDSGGPWISGNFAVGTHSAGENSGAIEKFAVATTLADSLTHIPGGVELQLFLNKPELVAPENLTFKAGGTIAGRVPAAPASAVAENSTVRITAGAQQPVEVPVDSAGNWSFPAPATTGPLTFTAETRNGFSRSGPAELAVSVSDLDAPVIAAPEGGAVLKTLGRIDGTGTPGLTVKLTGDVSGSAVVDSDGRWSVPLDRPVYGRIAVHAVQTDLSHVDSPSVTRTFTVTPAVPAAASIVDGLHFSQDSLPEAISGTGVDGADVAVSIDGIPVGAAQAGAGGAGAGARAVVRSMVQHVLVAGGRWSVPFPAGLAAGTHTLSVTQSVDGVASDPLLVTFTIDPAAAAAVHAPAAPPDPARAPSAGYSTGSGQLPNTGAGSILPAAGLAGASLLLGGALLVLGRRRALR